MFMTTKKMPDSLKKSLTLIL